VKESGLVVHATTPWLAASPDRFIYATNHNAAPGQTNTAEKKKWLLEIKVCVDSDLPPMDNLPLHVLQQVLVQLEVTQRQQAHVWFAKEGQEGRLYVVHYNSHLDHTTIITAGASIQELTGAWAGIQKKSWVGVLPKAGPCADLATRQARCAAT
jgi:hypothetical protein